MLRQHAQSIVRHPTDDASGGVSEQHPEYDIYRNIWIKCRDVILGEDAVKEAAELYLPKFKGMTDDDYSAYKMRAMFYGATGRTIQGLEGAVFRKDPVLESPKPLIEWARNITQDGKTLNAFSRDVIREQLSVGRVGILIDMPETGGVPYARLYTAEAIINWREVLKDGIPFLEQVVLQETVAEPSRDGFGSNFFDRYRVLEIEAETGFYRQRTFTVDEFKNDKGEVVVEFVEGPTIYPKKRRENLTFIPFVFVNADNLSPKVGRPPLLDLINVNLSHYRSSADLEHGRHFTALPVPVVSGVDQPEDEDDESGALRIGSGTAWVLPMGASARMLEFNGQGLKHLENALSEKEDLMVNLGARMLENQKRAAETAEALRLRQAGDQSMLSVMVDTASEGLTRALRWLGWWGELTGDPEDKTLKYSVNRDFFESRMSSQELAGLIAAWQKKTISFKDLYVNLVRGEIIDPERNMEEVRKDIMADVAVELEIEKQMAEERAKFMPEPEQPPVPGRRPAPKPSA